jgi:hypothetical protein
MPRSLRTNLLLALACLLTSPAIAWSADCGDGAVPLHRSWNPQTGDHFYTTDASESRNAARLGYQAEGTEGCLTTRPLLVPLYRMFHVQVHDHFYTTSAEEKDRARSLGYVEEGIEGYCSASRLPGTEPLYRLFNAQVHDHFYTTSAAERDRALGLGYVEEEIPCYVW